MPLQSRKQNALDYCLAKPAAGRRTDEICGLIFCLINPPHKRLFKTISEVQLGNCKRFKSAYIRAARGIIVTGNVDDAIE